MEYDDRQMGDDYVDREHDQQCNRADELSDARMMEEIENHNSLIS